MDCYLIDGEENGKFENKHYYLQVERESKEVIIIHMI